VPTVNQSLPSCESEGATEAVQPPGGCNSDIPDYDEMVCGEGTVRPKWRPLLGALHAMPEGAVAERMARVYRHYEDVGTAYDIESERQAAETRRPFDPVPMLLSAEEWAGIEAGLAQRARLLNAILADLYGPRRLIAEGRLPPALIQANPRFLRPCTGIAPPGGVHVHAYSAELMRLGDGQWRVLADRLQAPSGIGFALQNRSILARTIPEIFRAYSVRRIEPFFEIWQNSLMALAPCQERQPRLVVMTPGPFNPSFFEHVYLARQLGAMLVEGADLTLRDRRIYVKTLGHLQPIDVILRFMEDDYCDPLELRANSVLGVAGLLQAVRAGTVSLVNALGSSVVQTPALRPFLPFLSESLLGEELILPSVETEWLGSEGAVGRVEARLAEFQIKPAFAARREELAFAEEAERIGSRTVMETIRRRPQLFVAERRLRRSVIPVWTAVGLLPRPLTLRVFLIRHGDGYQAMPGGFAEVPYQRVGAVTPLAQTGMSKDSWVLAGEGDPTVHGYRPLPGPVKIQRSPDELRSRTADDLFWLGRYMERLDHAARTMRSAGLRLAVDRFGRGQRQELDHLLGLLVEHGLIDAGIGDVLPNSTGLFLAVSMAWSRDKALSGVFRAIQRVTQSLRDRMSNDLWTVMVGLLREARERLETRPQEVDGFIAALDNLIGVIAAFNGMASENMTRNAGWRFLDIGRRIERGVYGVSVLREVLAAGAREQESAFGLALELFDSSITYRARYLGAIQPGPVLDLVLADESNPRALAFQLTSVAQHLQQLGVAFEQESERPEQALIAQTLTELRRLPVIGIEDPADHDMRERLLDFCTAIRGALLTLSDTITRSYFSHVRVPHAVGYDGGWR
jgi:uncharacterized circularly permuted ATP-grasp superfamily protein/uncharacterized alpha-E superfamily protein